MGICYEEEVTDSEEIRAQREWSQSVSETHCTVEGVLHVCMCVHFRSVCKTLRNRDRQYIIT